MKKWTLRLVSLILMLTLLPISARADRWWDPLAVERQVYTYLTRELGLNSAAACGILANIEYESAFQVTNVGDQGTSYGLCQWHNERYTALRGYCLARGLDYKTVEGQMAYLAYELKSSYLSLYGALKAVENTPDGAYYAGYLWCVRFERPVDMEQKGVIRGNKAKNKYWNRYNSLSIFNQEETMPELEEIVEEIRREESAAVTVPVSREEEPVRTENGRRYVAPPLKRIPYPSYHSPVPVAAPTPPGPAMGTSLSLLFLPMGDGRKYGFCLPGPECEEDVEEEPDFTEFLLQTSPVM